MSEGAPGESRPAEPRIAYEVSVNGEEPVRCGAPELAVLSSMLTAVHERGGADLSVAGLVIRPDGLHEHWRWLARSLTIGDSITVRVVPEEECGAPLDREEIDPGKGGAP